MTRRVMLIDIDKFAAEIDAQVDEYKKKANEGSPTAMTLYTAISVAMNKTAQILIDSSIVEKWD